MPAIGERKTKDGVTGEWDGTTWRMVEAAADAAPTREGPPVGTRKTKHGVTGEWDGTTWRAVEDTPAASGSAALPAAAAVGAGALPAIAAGVQRVAEQVATSPRAARLAGKASKALGRLVPQVSAPLTAYQVLSGDLGGAAKTVAGALATSAVAKHAPSLALRLAGSIASAPAVPAAATAAGGGASMGAAVPLAVLKVIERDANRRPTIDPARNTPASSIFRGFERMAGR